MSSRKLNIRLPPTRSQPLQGVPAYGQFCTMSTQLWFQVIPCYCETVDRAPSVTILKKPHPFSVIQVEGKALKILVSNSLILNITQQKISSRDTHDKNNIKT